MKTKISYSFESIKSGEMIKDFLHPHKKIILNKDIGNVSINLGNSNLEFFKKQAKKYNVNYKQLIRYIIEKHAAQNK